MSRMRLVSSSTPCEVSVIVPVWRIPESLLRECAESLQRQTMDRMEVLWVIDGPDPDARDFLDTLTRTDLRMRVFQNTANLGVSSARNAGLERMSGRWFTFVDADDFVEPNLLEELLEAAQRGNAPLSCCGRRLDSGGTPPPGWKSHAVTLEFSIPNDLTRAMLLTHNGACWGRLFDREHFGKLRFDEDLKFGEDWVFVQRALEIAKRMAWTPTPLYIHRVREGSATRGALPVEDYRNWLEAMKRRTILARSLLEGNARATRLAAWDAWQGTNNPNARPRWTPTELRQAWMATRHFFESLAPEQALLPWDVRTVIWLEMRSLTAFLRRPRWLHIWLSGRAFADLLRLEKATKLSGKPLVVEHELSDGQLGRGGRVSYFQPSASIQTPEKDRTHTPQWSC